MHIFRTGRSGARAEQSIFLVSIALGMDNIEAESARNEEPRNVGNRDNKTNHADGSSVASNGGDWFSERMSDTIVRR